MSDRTDGNPEATEPDLLVFAETLIRSVNEGEVIATNAVLAYEFMDASGERVLGAWWAGGWSTARGLAEYLKHRLDQAMFDSDFENQLDEWREDDDGA